MSKEQIALVILCLVGVKFGDANENHCRTMKHISTPSLYAYWLKLSQEV